MRLDARARYLCAHDHQDSKAPRVDISHHTGSKGRDAPPLRMICDSLHAGKNKDDLHTAERGVEDGHLGRNLLVAEVAVLGSRTHL